MTSFASRSLPKYKKGSIGVAFASITDDEEPSQSSPEPEGVSSNVNEDDIAILSNGGSSFAAINRLRLVRFNADEPPQNRDEGDTIEDIDDDDEELDRNEDGDIDDTEDEQDDEADDEIIRLQQEFIGFNNKEFLEASSSPVNIGALDGLEL